MQTIERYLQQHQARFVEDLQALLRIPSISADSTRKGDVRRAAEFIHQQLTAAGLTAEIVETDGHPIVYGESAPVPGAPVAMVYGHYDVQPVDPLNQWITPPFEPAIRDGKIFARGATDDKGQMLTHLKSLEAWQAVKGKLPLQVKVVIEGEEEVGSKNLDLFLTNRREQLRCDVAVVSDTSQYAPGIPAITYGLRGILACEVSLQGPRQDLHSGVFGGAVANPVTALARLIAQLHDDQGRIQIPGFYDAVTPLTEEERRAFAALPFDERAFLDQLGVASGWGEAGFSSLERRWARPTCEINGISGGYQGEGPKTIVPARATAKITCRLVPRQDPEQLTAALQKFLEARCPPGVTLEFRAWHGCPAFVIERGSRFVAAARSAIETAFGTPPVLIREGGSIPVVASFREILGVDTLLLGWGQNTDNLHSPNEHFALADFQRGILASAHLWNHLAQLPAL